MVNSQYRASDKIRDLSRNTVIFSSLVIFFSFYHVPLIGMPLINLGIDPKIATEVLKDINITSILLIISIFYFFQLITIYLLDYIDFCRVEELKTVNLALENKLSARTTYQTLSDESQQAINSAQNILAKLHFISVLIIWARLLVDGLLPTLLFFVAAWREWKYLWNFVRLSLLS